MLSVGHTLVVPNEAVSKTRAVSEQKDEKFDKDVLYTQSCTIKCIFYDSTYKGETKVELITVSKNNNCVSTNI